MIQFLKMLPEWLIIAITIFGIISISGLFGAMIYRLVRFGIKIKVGKIEIDATEENEK